MAFEKYWGAVAPRFLTSNGTSDGVITLTTTKDLRVKQCIQISSNTEGKRTFQIQSVPSPTQIEVSEISGKITDRADVSAYTTADNAFIQAKKLPRPSIPQKEYERAVFEEEPVVAKRVINVDEYGNIYCDDNPFPVSLTGIDEVRIDNAQIDVDLTHLDNSPNPGDTADSVRIGDGNEILEINPDGSINVNTTGGTKETPNISVVTVVNANTEQTFNFPSGTTEYSIKIRSPKSMLKIAYESGDIAAGTYISVTSGKSYCEKNVNIDSTLPLYFTVGKDNTEVEILYWT